MAAPEDPLSRRFRPVRFLAGALLLGAVFILAIAALVVFVLTGGRGLAPAQGPVPVVTVVSAFVALAAALLAAFLPGVLTRATQRRLAAAPPAKAADADGLLAVRHTALVLSLVLLEGATVLGAVAYMLEAHALALAVVVGAVLMMLLRFPTEARVRAWLNRELGRLAARRLGRPSPAA